MLRDALIALTAVALACENQPVRADAAESDNPRELGRVRWGRDLDAALAASAKNHRPVFLLFQEIPGCQGCKSFGDEPLSHPLLVEAIEDEFIPVAIHNNKPGRDEEILERYKEPAWNYPVARFLNSDGKDLIPRRDSIFTVDGMAGRMNDALKSAKRTPPPYLALAAAEARTDAGHRAVATFAMYCFWEGEARLGSIDGVITTRAGFLDDSETVEVTFDPTVVSYSDLVKKAQESQCATTVYARNGEQFSAARSIAGNRARQTNESAKAAPGTDQKHTLAQSPLKYLPLTPMQATKVNAALHLNQNVETWLSPRQKTLAAHIMAALKKDEHALDGLQRPGSIDKLPEYDHALRDRLAKFRD